MKTLFVDFHGTVCHDPFWRSLDSDGFGRVQQTVFEADPFLVNDWMRGKYSSEQINELVAERTGLPFDRLWQTFVRDCKSMHIAPDLLTQFTALRNAYSVILITDNMDCFDRFTVPALRLDTVFDGIVNSASEGRLKTDGRGANFMRHLTGDISDAVLIDLFSRRVVGWSMQSRMTTDLALQALLAAVWRRKPKQKVMIHSDQSSQFTGGEWQSFLGKHNLVASMSRRGNCHDNAVAESFFHLLKRERIRRRTYLTRDAARQDVFDYIEMFYNPTRKHTNNGMLSPVDYEMKQQKMNEAGV